MGAAVCLWADTLSYPEGGGHLWVYLNWALGLRSAGCDVTWLEAADPNAPPEQTIRHLHCLRERLRSYALDDRLALCSEADRPLPRAVARMARSLDDAADGADLLLNLSYARSERSLRRFRRTALVDIDPGLLQVWLSERQVTVARHDVFFTIGETVGQADAAFPTAGIDWHYTPPCVSLEHWPVAPEPQADAPFTTVTNWSTSKEWVVYGSESYRNDKRSGFEPFFDLPRMTRQPLTLALCLRADGHLRLEPEEVVEKRALEQRGWRIVHSFSVSATPWHYQRFIHGSKGEFSCCKPSCVRLRNAWISDRTICYLASGRPAVVQHTGASRFLPDAAGIFRFRDPPEAARHLEAVAADYPRQCRLARQLAEELFDARKVVARVLERAL